MQRFSSSIVYRPLRSIWRSGTINMALGWYLNRLVVAIQKHFKMRLKYMHILKYSDERIGELSRLEDTNSPLLLQIETLGSDGLRFRHNKNHKQASAWIDLPSATFGTVKDTAGAGDWCTAGLLFELLRRVGRAPSSIRVEDAKTILTFAQAWLLGAVNT